jgi:hypothetical protein
MRGIDDQDINVSSEQRLDTVVVKYPYSRTDS